MFKIQKINRDRFSSTRSIASVIGNAFHNSMEVYYGENEEYKPKNEAEAIQFGLETGMDFLDKYNDGWIEYNTSIANKQKAQEKFAFGYNEYVKWSKWGKDEIVGLEIKIEEEIGVEWKGQKVRLPVKLMGYIDKIIRDEKGRIKIIDYKTTSKFTNLDKIDGVKMIQAVQYYFLVYAYTGEKPYSFIYEEVKLSKNRDGSPQVREYEIVYEKNELYFDFFFRLYEDVTSALNGKMVYVPNINTFYDNEISIISYIHRLDQEEEKADLMKKMKVDNVTDLLKKKIQSAGNMRKLMKTAEKKFISAKNLNYENMTNEEKIQTKMMEHGMMLQFDSKVEGVTVDLYRYTPSIGLKMSQIRNFSADVEQVLGKTGIRVLAPIPNSTLIGFEVPRNERVFPELPTEVNGFEISVGQDIMGKNRKFDIREAPHILVAGATRSGKSVFLSGLIRQISRMTNVDLHLYDPKIVELGIHKNDANVKEYQTDIVEVNKSLGEMVKLMNKRYDTIAKRGQRNIEGMKNMRYKFLVIDEFGDLVAQNYKLKETIETGKVFQKGAKAGMKETKQIERNISDEIEQNILILAQKARAAGIHLIIATQRPSVDVVKGTIKANFPVKVVFKTASSINSQLILDESGAEKLSGKGDMLFASNDGIERLQGYNI